MNSITAASSPSSTGGASSSNIIGETVYIIIFSIGLTIVLLTIIVAFYYFCRTHVWSPTSNLNHQRASPIAAVPNPSQPQQPVAGATKEAGLLDNEALLSTYPKLSYSQVKQQQQGNLTGSSGGLGSCCCSICLVDYKDDDTLLVLPYCAHFYHVKCGLQWLRLHPTCPVCRNLASPASVHRQVSQLELLAPPLPIPEDDYVIHVV
ncbi:putative RING-H2 finger protein ATL71 [Humulus lupulus]|uniref:putative RING-H2 finger protein ATL71 n=1 Tax=Humulus lupulus TaxID=3486 RepID=UPI002B40CAE8|nr:putative RING-H2 finger protein ATL71 [Humulus lupulus]